MTEAFKKQAGVNFLHVPYKGGTAVALISGQVALTFSIMPPAVANLKGGKFIAMGVTSAKRVGAAPAVPRWGRREHLGRGIADLCSGHGSEYRIGQAKRVDRGTSDR